MADVPVGAYLSGGLDSSVLVALMRQLEPGTIKIFSIGFDSAMDETSQARDIAARFETEHHELQCRDVDFEHLDRLVWHLDEPIGDVIVLPMYLLAREARRHVKVVLKGEGADEIFGGYLFHKVLLGLCTYRRYVPYPLRSLVRLLLRSTPHTWLNQLFDYPAQLSHDGKDKLVSFLEEMEYASLGTQYRSIISLFHNDTLMQLYQPDFRHQVQMATARAAPCSQGWGDLDQILSLQYQDWLPDDILMKLDKMTMAHGLRGACRLWITTWWTSRPVCQPPLRSPGGRINGSCDSSLPVSCRPPRRGARSNRFICRWSDTFSNRRFVASFRPFRKTTCCKI